MPIQIARQRLHPFTDDRGLVFEPLPEEGLANQRNIHVVVSRPGAVRGNHYHPRGEETVVVVGPALVRIREGGETADITIPAEAIYRLTIPPGVAHAVKNTGSRDSLLVAFNTESHDPDAPDIVPHPLIEP